MSALLFTREVFGNTNSLLRYVDIFLSMMEPYTVEAPKNTLGTAATIDPHSQVGVRFAVGVYCDDMGEGKLNVLNIIERIRHRLLKREAIGGHFLLMDRIDWAIDPATNGQYFFGEMLASFELPPVQPDFPDFDNLAYKNTRWFTDRTEELSCLRSEISE